MRIIVSKMEIISEQLMSALSKRKSFKDNFFKIVRRKLKHFFKIPGTCRSTSRYFANHVISVNPLFH